MSDQPGSGEQPSEDTLPSEAPTSDVASTPLARWRDRVRGNPRAAGGVLAGALAILVLTVVGVMMLTGGGTEEAPRALSVSPSGEEAPRLGPVVISFVQAPPTTEPERLVHLEPAVNGTYAWLDDRTLLFQPEFPGLQRGAQYLVRVDGAAAGIGDDYVQSFTVEGKLTVRSVIPSAVDVDVPPEARIFVQFSRSVAPLTLLSEQDTSAIVQFEPALTGHGEWLNTSLYVFTPDNLQPSTTYRARIPAGLTSAADGVLEEDYEWEFSTYQPALATIEPADATSFVPPDSVVTLTFNQAMDRASVEASVRLAVLDGAGVATAASWSTDSKTITLTPENPLAISTTYEVTVPAGLRGAIGGASESERVTTFATVDQPRLVTSSPGKDEQNAGRHGLYLEFNNPIGLNSLETHLSISGIDREDWVVQSYGDDRYVQVNVNLDPSTAYTVSIAAGVTDRSGLALDPISFSFTTGALEPQVSYAVPGQFATYSSTQEQELLFFVTNKTSVSFELYEVPESQALSVLRAGYVPAPPGIPNWTPGGNPIRSWSVPAEGSENTSILLSTTLSEGAPLAKGYYYVRTPGGQWNSGVLFAVVDTSIVTKLSLDELLVWAIDSDTGEPVSGLAVTANGPGASNAQARTNADGIASFAVPRPSELQGNDGSRDYVVTATSGGRFAVSRTDWATGAEPWALGVPLTYWDQEMVAHVYTDRPIYRSGETVEFKAVLRLDHDASYQVPPPGDTGRFVVITDAQGEEIYREPAVTNEYGTFAGRLALPAEAPTGYYNVSVRDTSQGYELWISSVAFQVAEFRTPEFRVEMAPGAPEVIDGAAIDVELEASFFFGGPLEGAAVSWNAYGFPTSVSFPDYARYSFTDYDFYQESIFEDAQRASGETVTDSSGHARMSVPGVLRAGESTTQFEVNATVLDQSGQAIGTSARVTVHPSAIYAGIAPAEYVARQGASTPIDVVTVDVEGRPVANRAVAVQVYRREWVTVREQTASGARRYRSEPRDTLLETLSVTTGADGLGRVAYTPKAAGVLRVVATTQDTAGRSARAATYLWVSGSGYAPWQVRNDSLIELVADRDAYRVGDVAEVLIPAPFEGAQALITIERGSILTREVRRLATNSETLSIPIEDGFVPNVYVSVVLYREPTPTDPVPRYHVGYVELPVSTESRELNVELVPSVDQAEPGQTVRYDVNVTDSAGRPVQAELSVNMVDAAVLSLSSLVDQDGLQAFWYERPLGVRTGSSVSVSVERANDVVSEPESGGKGGGDGEDALRTEFRNTAFWEAQVATDAAGHASVEITLPDNLTTWRTQVRAVSGDTLVGEATNELLSTKPLLVRPALPRFVRVGDAVTLRTLVRNNTEVAQEMVVSVTAAGLDLGNDATQTLVVQPNQSGEFQWPATASVSGTASVSFRAVAAEITDAVKIEIPVYLDVTPETIATGGVVTTESQVEGLYLPPYALLENGSLEVGVQASIVGALRSELSAFAPIPFEGSVRVASRVIGTLSARGAEGLTGDDLLSGVEDDLRTLQALQRSDGGWAWCTGFGCTSDPAVTAWVMTAFGDARDVGWSSPSTGWRRGSTYLRNAMSRTFDVLDPPNPNERAFYYWAAQHGTGDDFLLNSLRSVYEQDRAQLTPWGRAYLVLGLIEAGQPLDDPIVRGLISDLNASVIPSANGNHWEGAPIYGSIESNVSMTSLVLQALVAADPEHPLIEETARWLVAARDAQRWQSSIERAQAIRGLGAFAALTGERSGDFEYHVRFDQDEILAGRLAPGEGTNAASITLPLSPITTGEVHRLSFQRETTLGRMYYVLNLRYVTPAADVEAVSRGLSVAHSYSLLADPDRAISEARLGDVVRVTVTVVADADRKFVQVEDFLPAGFEAIDSQLATVSDDVRRTLEEERQQALAGGNSDGESAYAPWYRWYWSPWDETNVRDDRFTMFATELPRGVHEYVYYARATTPGDFFVAPARAEEGPFPGVFGRSDSGRFRVTE